jgi:hypothetical protein
LECSHCLTKKHRNGNVSYSHSILQAAIVHPDKKQVIPLMPEQISNQDGSAKQDCEMNAGKRLITKIRKDHPQLGLIIVGDGLYSKQPFVEALQGQRMHYLLVAKANDHKTLMKEVEAKAALGKLKRKEIVDIKGRHVYEWVEQVALNAKKNTVLVNYFRYYRIVKDKEEKEKRICSYAWISDLEIKESNVELLVRAGRARWKIENEGFNTLKNQGYYIDHNYGHGKKNLSFNFFIFTLLAFFFHQIFEITDSLYQASRKHFGSKAYFWECLRGVMRLIFFNSWEHLLKFNLETG